MGPVFRSLILALFCFLVAACGGGGAASGGSSTSGSAASGGVGSVPTTFAPGKTGVALDISVKRTPAREDVRLATAADVQEVLIDFLDPTTLQPAVNTTIVKRSAAAVDVVIDVPVGTWILRIQGRTASGEVAGTRFETTITVREGQTTEATAELNPATNLTRVDVTPGPTTQLVVGTSSQFTATGLLSDLTTVPLTGVAQWTSSNPSVATVTTAGLVLAIGPGTAVITARSGAVQGSSTVTVTAVAVRELQVTPSNTTLTEGLTQQLTATAVLADNSNQNVTDQATWTSSAPNVATVTNTGLVTAGSPGNATIRASFGGREASAVISVNPTLVRLELSPTNLTLPVGISQSVRATGIFSNNSTQDLSSTVTWSSANPATATVSSTGEVSGVAAGTTNVTATADNVTATAAVRVEPLQLTRLSITPPSATVAKGATQAFNATGTFSNNSTRDVTDEVTWTSTNSSVLAISNANGTRGLATAVNAGGTVIEATLDGISAAASANVTPATLVSLTLSPANPQTGSGNVVVFTARGTFSDGTALDLTTNVTWTSGNTSVATISNAAGTEGNALSVAGGTTTITAAFGNVTASTSFTTTVPVPPPAVSPTPVPLANVLANYNSSNTNASNGPCDNRGKKSLSADGTLVVFVGDYFNDLVVPGGTDQGIYVRNTTTNTTVRVTPDPGVGPGGGAGDFGSPGISADGRYVVFDCRVRLVAEDTNAVLDIYLIDRNDPLLTPRLVSVNPATGLAAGSTEEASLSDDGRYVVFTCPVPLTADANAIASVYRRDMTKANNDPTAIELCNRRSDGSAGNPTRSCQPKPEISSDGRYVIFSSDDDSLAGSPSTNFRIYRRDTLGGPGSTVLVSQDAAVGDALLPGTNAGGSIIAYEYQEGGQREIYVRDLATALPTLVSFTHDGLTANGDNIDPTVSADGRFVTWSSTATNLVPTSRGPKPKISILAVGDPQNIFVRDRAGAQNAIALLTPRFAGSTGNCSGARLSPNGRGVAFTSTAGDLINGLTFVGQNVYRFANPLAP